MSAESSVPAQFRELHADWQAHWEKALEAWSKFTKLSEPRWCFTAKDNAREQLSGSFAMIRLIDHAVVIDLAEIAKLKLTKFATEILAHEIGHHVYTPGDLRDNARMLMRIRKGLPTRERYAPFIANLYSDLLLNDRLQRSAGLDMTGVYKALPRGERSAVWTLYMRIYEILWSLPLGSLGGESEPERLELDASLGARVIRVYSKDWLRGAGGFAALFLPYLLEIPELPKVTIFGGWLDTKDAGSGDVIPDGFAEIEEGEDEALHPADDKEVMGEDGGAPEKELGGRAIRGGKKTEKRPIESYRELMKSLGVKVSDKEITIRYYRELAMPYCIQFPRRILPQSTDPHPEGLDVWEMGSPLTEIDWTESIVRSPAVIPGVTTLKRLYGESPGEAPNFEVPDLYIGIDCSGSMSNPAMTLSYPALAGVVMALSALRAGARVMVCLSGEPGRFSETDGFTRNERDILGMLTNYLGTGSSFGIARLKDTFLGKRKLPRPVQIIVVSDSDIFWMIGEGKDGWTLIEEAARAARGGATFVLEISPAGNSQEVDRMNKCGWDVYRVHNQAELVAFAEAFSRKTYQQKAE